MLSHKIDDVSDRPIAYASRTLNSAEKKYSQIEREALSLVFGVNKFHKFLYGRKFVMYTDHKPLIAIFGDKKGVPAMAAARLQRWAIALSGYSYEIRYKNGKEHSNADALSRLPVEDEHIESAYVVNFVEQLPVTADTIRKYTEKDPVLRKVCYYVVNGWPYNLDKEVIAFKHRSDTLSIERGCLISGYRVVIPPDLRENILTELHGDHVGIVRMKAQARSLVWWPNIDSDIEIKGKQCLTCQLNQSNPVTAPLHPWPVADGPWERIHIDYAEKCGKTYLLGIDSYSRWPEICLVKYNSTATMTIECMRSWFASYGLPKYVVSDNGPQFTSAEFTSFLRNNGVKHILTPPYHSASNGMAERLVRSFKASLNKNNSINIVHQIQNFLYSYRTTPHSATEVTPAELFLKRQVRTRLSLVKPNQRDINISKQLKDKINHDSTCRKQLREINANEKVLVRNALTNLLEQGIVVERKSNVTYVVDVNGRRILKHIDQIIKLNEPRVIDSQMTNGDLTSEQSSSPEISNENNDTQNDTNNRYPVRNRNPPKRLIEE